MKKFGAVLLGVLLANCATPNLASKGKMAKSTAQNHRHTQPVPLRGLKDSETKTQQPPGEWNSAATAGGPGLEIFNCEFPVPSAPPYAGQSIFLWCGVQQASGISETEDKSFGVLQPVLMFGPDCVEDSLEGRKAQVGPSHDQTYKRNPYWYYSAQYVYPQPFGSKNYKCTTGPLFKAVPGEILVSSITYNPGDDSMIVTISAKNGSRTSVLKVAHPLDNYRWSWNQFVTLGGDQVVLEGALEVPNPVTLSMLPTEILSGWYLRASVKLLTTLPLTSDDQWQLLPNSANLLSVKCDYQSATHESNCVWAQQP
jgi:hypothetical protein